MTLRILCLLFVLVTIVECSEIDHAKAGDIAFQKGNFARAKEIYRKAVAEAASSGPYQQGVDPNISRLVACEARLGQLKQERETLLQQIKSIESKQGKSTARLAFPLNMLAQVSGANGDYVEAAACLERALAIYQKHLYPENPATSYVLNSLAFLYHVMNKTNAADFFHRSLQIRQERIREDPLQEAISLANRAWESSSPTEAQKTFGLSVKRFEQSGFGQHPYLADVLRSYAVLLEKSGESQKAQELQTRAAEIRKECCEPQNP